MNTSMMPWTKDEFEEALAHLHRAQHLLKYEYGTATSVAVESIRQAHIELEKAIAHVKQLLTQMSS